MVLCILLIYSILVLWRLVKDNLKIIEKENKKKKEMVKIKYFSFSFCVCMYVWCDMLLFVCVCMCLSSSGAVYSVKWSVYVCYVMWSVCDVIWCGIYLYVYVYVWSGICMCVYVWCGICVWVVIQCGTCECTYFYEQVQLYVNGFRLQGNILHTFLICESLILLSLIKHGAYWFRYILLISKTQGLFSYCW